MNLYDVVFGEFYFYVVIEVGYCVKNIGFFRKVYKFNFFYSSIVCKFVEVFIFCIEWKFVKFEDLFVYVNSEIGKIFILMKFGEIYDGFLLFF